MAHILDHNEKALAESETARVSALIGRVDARLRVVAALCFGIVVVSLTALPALMVAFALSLGLLAMSGLRLKPTLKRMAMMDGFIVFMLILLPFSTPGDVMFDLWGFPASWQGLWRAVEIGLTANAVILALMTLVGTLEPVTLAYALHKLKVPETLVHLLMFTIRYIDVLREEYLRLRAAMKVRGFRPGTNFHTYRSFGYLVGMMLVRAVERSERILGAMKCRGFSGRIYLLQDFALTGTDHRFAALFSASLVMLICLEFLCH